MKKLLVINNIPTPYRTFMFRRFHELAGEFDFESTVAFQARREERRAWNPDEMDLDFPHFFSKGRDGKPREFFTYKTVNPDIIRRVRSGEFDFVVMSAFMSVSSWLTSLLPARGAVKVLWSESNLLSTRHMSGLSRAFKRALMKPYHINAVPGDRALEYIRTIDPAAAEKPKIQLPNIVDSRIFIERTAGYRKERAAIREALGVRPDQTLIFGIGMMFEKKGFDLAIDAAKQIDGNYKMIFLGDGPRREDWLKRIESHGLSDRIKLPGQASPEEVARHFAAADWFFHPARFDPSPLVVIEAATAGMPLAISRQAGNSPEALDEGRSGIELDASGVDEMADGIRKMLAVPDEQRIAMGAHAAEVAKRVFDPDTVVRNFYTALNQYAS